VSPAEPNVATSSAQDVQVIRFPVAGMTCVSCVGRITRAIARLDGVRHVHVDLRRETATVVRERASVSDAALAAAVAGAGYDADLASAEVLPATRRPNLLDRLRGRA
jgi:Cu+-exporting ATPase